MQPYHKELLSLSVEKKQLNVSCHHVRDSLNKAAFDVTRGTERCRWQSDSMLVISHTPLAQYEPALARWFQIIGSYVFPPVPKILISPDSFLLIYARLVDGS